MPNGFAKSKRWIARVAEWRLLRRLVGSRPGREMVRSEALQTLLQVECGERATIPKRLLADKKWRLPWFAAALSMR